eukprot:jgi/Orpsp1_1/1183363/evm.model.c7180000084854.1
MRCTFILCIIASLSLSISNGAPVPCLGGLALLGSALNGHIKGNGNANAGAGIGVGINGKAGLGAGLGA